uniref:DUF8077 domain-containing protein n=1 Tax=Parastrongyloides trichosuri TaxID=131310 RepID=A0A0N4Z609_PARTI
MSRKISCNIYYLFITLIYFVSFATTNSHYTDPSQAEVEYVDWVTGVQIVFCKDTFVTSADIENNFKKAIVNVINKHCRNSTACGLRRPVVFTPQNIIFMEGFPRREYEAINFRFLIVLPTESIPMKKISKPLLHKQYSSDAFKKFLVDEITSKLGWHVLYFEKYPKYDQITEFMNIALIPIALTAGLLMICLAYWSTCLNSIAFNNGDWIVSGASGGKNAALRRTMEIISEQEAFFNQYMKEKQCYENLEGKENNDKKNFTMTSIENAPQFSNGKDRRDYNSNKNFAGIESFEMQERIRKASESAKENLPSIYEENESQFDDYSPKLSKEDNFKKFLIPSHRDSDCSILTQEQEAQIFAKLRERNKRRISINTNTEEIKEIKRFRRVHAKRNSMFSVPSPKRKSICSPGRKQWKTGSIMINFMRKR